MQEIEELESRLGAALGRIGKRLEAVQAPDGEEDEGEIGRLTEALKAERDAMHQLDERYKRLRKRQQTQLRKLEAELEDMTERAEAAEQNAARLLAANERLREAAEALRDESGADGVNPKRINRLLLEENVALREARAADREELDELLAQLAPFAEDADQDEEKA